MKIQTALIEVLTADVDLDIETELIRKDTRTITDTHQVLACPILFLLKSN